MESSPGREPDKKSGLSLPACLLTYYGDDAHTDTNACPG